jgi:DNA-directed RNA polymerase subunit beta
MLDPFLINKKNLKFFFSGKRNKIKTKASKIDNNLDKLISIEYSLDNFHRSNQDTCLVHKPSVFEGQWVQSGDLLADCSASVGGELALGQNILIAYMPWEGYNFEDAILVSERLVYDDLYTSVHIERYELELRQTKQGMEEITREIPDVSEASLKHLNNFGIAKLGSWIKEGDILVGKVTPVNKKIQSNYQKLLYTILEKTVLPFRDTSLRAPKGIKAKVIGVQIFKHSKNSLVSDFRLKKLEDFNFENKKKSNLKKKIDSDSSLIREAKINKFLKLYSSVKLNTKQPIQKTEKLLDSKNLNKNFSKTKTITDKKIKNLFINKNNLFLNNKKINKNVNSDLLTIKKLFNLINFYDNFSSACSWMVNPLAEAPNALNVTKLADCQSWSNTLTGSQLEEDHPAANQRLNDVSSIQIYLAEKRRLQVGDKMAGRHGNKGIISQILPIEDMPFLPDGKSLDMVLNPLGVPSRMNVGQIYECLLGLAGKYLGQHFKIFPFDEMYGAEASRSFVFSKLYDARLKTGKEWLFNQKAPGKIRLYDGRTGETFDQSITVGYAYMLRLVHMVDDKIHARSTGP